MFVIYANDAEKENGNPNLNNKSIGDAKMQHLLRYCIKQHIDYAKYKSDKIKSLTGSKGLNRNFEIDF